MAKISIGWRVFIAIESIAVVSWTTWGLFSNSMIGQFLWGTQLILLMPGNITAAPLIERALWWPHTSLSLLTIGIAELAVSILANAVIWFVLLLVFRRIKGLYALTLRSSGAARKRAVP